MDPRETVPELELPKPFGLADFSRGVRWTTRKLLGAGALLTALGVLAGAAVSGMRAQGYQGFTPEQRLSAMGDSVRATGRRVTVIETRVVPLLTAQLRYSCLQSRQKADLAGMQCDALLRGESILTPQSSPAPADGSYTSSVANR